MIHIYDVRRYSKILILLSFYYYWLSKQSFAQQLGEIYSRFC